MTQLCFCGSEMDFDTCCNLYLSKKECPETPEQLMRSRYSAFCKADTDYLISTHHPTRRAPDEKESLDRTILQTRWLGLRIIDAPAVRPGQSKGFVEFAAFYDVHGVQGQIHENSTFILEKSRWYYLDGRMLEPVTLKRNEVCFCGSAKKYKKCHGR